MRLFVAIPLSGEMKDAACGVQDAFRAAGIRGGYAPRENLHITLAFIGEYGDPKEVTEALSAVSFSPFSVTMDRIGCFEDLWWTGYGESRELETLAARVRRALADAGIPFDRKKFRPHTTILRHAEIRGRGGNVPELAEGCSMQVDRICLMRSDRGKNGMIYTEIAGVEADL
jgi:2'-5' RNA ligase